MSAVIKNDLLLKDELDPIESTPSTGLMEASSFKNKDASSNNGCIKDEFTDEMDDAYCCEGDQDTETDELNDAEEINDEMTVIEGDEEEEEEVEMDEQLGDENEDDSLINQEEEEGEEDPLNDPLLGSVSDPYSFDTNPDPAF
jgi:two-component system chemotaxis sensor kinase CheA